MQRIVFDNQIFAAQRHGGISRYFAELLKHRDSLGEEVELECSPPVAVSAHVRELQPRTMYLPTASRPAVDRWVVRGAAVAGLVPPRGWAKFDAIHHTYYNPVTLRLTSRAKRISTLHDMIPERFPELFRRNHHAAKQQYLERSDLIICVSKATLLDMLEFWPHLERKQTAVIHLGVGDIFTPQGPQIGVTKPYLLFVGHRGHHKDFPVLLKALGIVDRTLLRDLDIRATGGGPFTSNERRLIESLNMTDRVSWEPSSDRQLARLYRGAAAFVYPSKYEGFGLPVLESLASGCRTVLADTPVFREVSGGNAAFFRAGSAEHLATVLAEVLSDDRGSRESVRRGVLFARTRTWAECSQSTGQAYKRI